MGTSHVYKEIDTIKNCRLFRFIQYFCMILCCSLIEKYNPITTLLITKDQDEKERKSNVSELQFNLSLAYLLDINTIVSLFTALS